MRKRNVLKQPVSSHLNRPYHRVSLAADTRLILQFVIRVYNSAEDIPEHVDEGQRLAQQKHHDDCQEHFRHTPFARCVRALSVML